MRPACHVLAALVVVSLGAGAGAGVTVGLSDVPPNDLVVISQAQASDSVLEWRYSVSGQRRDVGQTFRSASAFTLGRITILAAGQSGAWGANFVLDIYRFSGPSAVNPDACLSTHTGTMPPSGAGNEFYITFDIDEVPLLADKQYGFLLSFCPAAATRIVTVRHFVEGSAYAAGTCFEDTGSGTFSAQDFDLVFYLQRPVPEPVTFSLLTAGLAGLLLMARKKGRSPSRTPIW